MTDRVNGYYMLPASRALVEHFRNNLGIQGKYLEIFDDLRGCMADTSCHASNVGLPLKRYNEMCGTLSVRCMSELVRLAEIGLKSDRMLSE